MTCQTIESSTARANWDPNRAAGLRELDPTELEGIEGGFWPFVAALVVGGAILLYSTDAY